MRHATTAARNVVSLSTLIGPFELGRALVSMELLFLLRFGTFPVEEKAICGVTSGQ